MNVLKRIENLDEQLKNLASRPTTAKIEKVSATLKNEIEEVDAEMANTMLAIVETLAEI